MFSEEPYRLLLESRGQKGTTGFCIYPEEKPGYARLLQSEVPLKKP